MAAARFDNRDELCDSFGIPYPERPATPDGRLIQLAYERWSEKCPKKLYGDWSFAVWDYRRQQLFLARDQLGNTGLFYFHQPPFFAFASSLKALLALPKVPRQLNEWQLARYLLLFSNEYGSETFWRELRLLVPGSTAVVTSHYCATNLYWRPEETQPVRLSSDQEYLEGFLEHYRRAVSCRLDSVRPVGATLCAGLDSGSVTALAANILQSRGERLTAFTSVPIYSLTSLVPGKIADEWPLAHSITEYVGNVEHVPIRAESVSPITGLERLLEIFHEPVYGVGNMFWFFAMHDEAVRREMGVMLTGQLGNCTVSWTGGRDYIFFQFLRGHWDTARRSLLAWKQKQNTSFLVTLKHHMLRPLFGPLWAKRHCLIKPFAPPWVDYAAINSDFARRLGLKKDLQARCENPGYAKPLAPERERFLKLWPISAAIGFFIKL